MNKLVVTLNYIIAIYFFVLANILFWSGLIGLFVGAFIKPKLFSHPWDLIIMLFLGIISIYVTIIYFMKAEYRYKYGMVLVFIVWAEAQIYRFIWVTNQKLEWNDLSNFVFYAIPFLVIYLTKQLNKKYNRA